MSVDPAAAPSTGPVEVATHRNNFDAIRLGAALLVMVSHQWFFVGRVQPRLAGLTLGEIAVLVFFVISGYLVAESWYRDPHLVRYLGRRLLRIWPALAVATVVIAVAGAVATRLPLHDYLRSGVARFIGHNLQFRVVYDLPGVFAASAGGAMGAVNGSWWSIPVELKCYLYLAVLGLIGLRRRWFSLLALGVAAWLCLRTRPGALHANELHHLKNLCIAFFMGGLCARQFRAWLVHWRWWLALAGAGLWVVALLADQQDLVAWLVLVPLVLVGGSLSTPGLRQAAHFGDLSYGTYIYAYFVQQLSVRHWPGTTPSVAGSLLVAVLVTLGLAWVSWRVVEAPALRLKRRLRRWFPDRAP